MAAALRLYGINWDSGFHFHPDERMLIMVTERIHFWTHFNPDFFNYGSLPVYLLRAVSQLIDLIFRTHITNYDGMLYVGRVLSSLADLGVVFLIFHISFSIFKNKIVALWSSFFYAVAFFPIQNSHFFIVDTFLNLFSTLLIYLLLRFHQQPSNRILIMIGITFAAAITSKISAIIFLPIILFVFFLSQLKKTHRNVTRSTLHVIRMTFFFSVCSLAFAILFMPYAFIEHERFFNDVLQQIRMNADAYIFPYTLQYVGTTPYIYYLKNIFLWGVGPVISIFAVVGGVCSIWYVVCIIYLNKKEKFTFPDTLFHTLHSKYFLFSIFYFLYFLVIGKSAVKFMRYMLLVYPFITILAGYGADRITQIAKRNTFSKGISRYTIHVTRYMIVLITFLWTLPFLMIYSTPNTRIQATQWINQFIPYGSTLAVEHWDDRVPIFDSGNYQYEELTLYELPDDQNKITDQYHKLQRSDYIIIASNRLYTPLQRLNDCAVFEKCYPLTAQYYQDLFDGKLGFVKIAEFTSYPALHAAGYVLRIVDDSADESFTVYDHPKVMIFKKI